MTKFNLGTDERLSFLQSWETERFFSWLIVLKGTHICPWQTYVVFVVHRFCSTCLSASSRGAALGGHMTILCKWRWAWGNYLTAPYLKSVGLSSIKHRAPPSFISGFHSETEQSTWGGGSWEGKIVMERPSPLSTKLYKKKEKKGMRKIACLFLTTVERRASVAISHSCASRA